MARDFMLETDKDLRPRLVALGIVSVVVLIGAVATGLYVRSGGGDVPNVIATFQALLDPSSEAITPATLFVSGALSGMFFLPVPIEVAFILGMRAGNPLLVSVVAVVSGFVLGNVISYVIGWKLSRYVTYLVSTKKLYQLRRKVNRYGAYAIFGMNLIPSPSPVLTFGVGIARYNMLRLFVLLVTANMVKFTLIAAFIVLTR